MKIEIRARNLPLEREVRDQVERRLDFALSRFAPRLEMVRVIVSDLNGPRGGVDKFCRLEIVGRPGWSLYLEETDRHLPAAIDRLADRAGRVVGRTVNRIIDRSTGRDAARAAATERRADR